MIAKQNTWGDFSLKSCAISSKNRIYAVFGLFKTGLDFVVVLGGGGFVTIDDVVGDAWK